VGSSGGLERGLLRCAPCYIYSPRRARGTAKPDIYFYLIPELVPSLGSQDLRGCARKAHHIGHLGLFPAESHVEKLALKPAELDIVADIGQTRSLRCVRSPPCCSLRREGCRRRAWSWRRRRNERRAADMAAHPLRCLAVDFRLHVSSLSLSTRRSAWPCRCTDK
jgi:hypothetical protein